MELIDLKLNKSPTSIGEKSVTINEIELNIISICCLLHDTLKFSVITLKTSLHLKN